MASVDGIGAVLVIILMPRKELGSGNSVVACLHRTDCEDLLTSGRRTETIQPTRL